MRGHAVVCVERVEQGTQDTALWGSYVQGDGVGGELAHFHHLWFAGEEVYSSYIHDLPLTLNVIKSEQNLRFGVYMVIFG